MCNKKTALFSCIGNRMISSAIWNKKAQVNFSKTTEAKTRGGSNLLFGIACRPLRNQCRKG